ncbi:MAG: hypothetical protein F2859_01320 [Actinobacteria bacterium]|nr:hypothetical protein [Actinomycetota bacterium]MSY77982.1 hypothetical protein [Actinomycetota bacterium]
MKIKKLLDKSSGSAISEFLIFTLPFFTAFLIMITMIQQKAMAISESNNLARQAVRAFVTSPNEELALVRANQVIEIYRSTLSTSQLNSNKIELAISCTKYPCFSPGNMVIATISTASNQIASATEYVDLWR